MEEVFTLYVTAQAVVSELQDDASRAKAIERFHRSGVRRVILEGYRGGLVVEEAMLAETRDFFEAEGFETLGGVMPVWGEGFGKQGEGIEVRGPFFCYSDEATVAALEAVIRTLARVFGEVVVDDGFLTACRCSVCQEHCADGDWFGFRRDLLCAVAERWVRAAHEEKARCRVTVKFPQYYDRYQRFGYDAARFPAIFDAVWVGTETRDPTTHDYGYVEPYQGYFNARWMKACAGKKFEAAWFDYLDCDEQLFYDQGVTTFLGAPRDVTVFCYGEELFGGSKMARLSRSARLLARLRDIAVEPWGVHVYKPPNADGGRDLFIFDYLGMLGIPCVPVTQIEAGMRTVFVPEHGAREPETKDRIRDILALGGNVIVTFNTLHRMVNHPDFLDMFGYDYSGVVRTVVPAEQFGCGRERRVSERPVHLAGDLAPYAASVRAWGCLTGVERGSMCVPLLTEKTYSSGGKALVWNIGTFGHDAFTVREQLNVPKKTDLFGLPKDLVNLLRSTATEALGITIEVPGQVASFLFEQHLVLVNYSPETRDVHTQGIHPVADTFFSDSANSICLGDDFILAPHSFAAVAIRARR